jgi:hypothetical protein
MADNVGFARMEDDGTLVLDLIARAGGARGHARKVYPPSHADYNEVLAHLGGLRPGEEKPIPPWPDPWDAERVEAAARDHAARAKGWEASAYRLEITGTDSSGNACVTLAHEAGHLVDVRIDPVSCSVVREIVVPRHLPR